MIYCGNAEFGGICRSFLLNRGAIRHKSPKNLIQIGFLSLIFLLPVSPLRSDQAGLYSGEVPVMDQSPGERSRAMPLALMQVLQKLTGLRSFVEFPDLEPALTDARSMVIAFYYRNSELLLPDGGTGRELRLVADFSKAAVDGLIQAMRLPVWKPERRPLTIWLVIDDGFSRRIMPVEFEYVWETMADVADARGMPLARPQPDDEGAYAVDLQLLWGGYTEDLTESGPVDALIIAARREGPEWNVRMNLDYMGALRSWRYRDGDIQNAIVEGLQQAIDEISAGSSIAAADQGQWSFPLAVTGLSAAGDYIRCLGYLQGLSLVDHVRVSAARSGRVQFVLRLNALPEYFQRALASDGILAPTSTEGEYALLR